MDEQRKKRIAIACQGGGSHAAFTAGTLDVFLDFLFDNRDEYELVALSGTSGGAVCAFLGWYALTNGGDAEEATGVATDTLRSFWTEDNSAHWKAGDPLSALDVLANTSLAALNLWRSLGEAASGVDLGAQINPYDRRWRLWAGHWRDRFRAIIQKHVEKIDAASAGAGRGPMLFIGAVNALTGEFRVFRSHKKMGDRFVPNDGEDKVGVDAVLASAAIPFVFEATRTGEAVYWVPSLGHNGQTLVRKGVYWDGLYSQNPPVRELTDAEPDEIWVIQIDPEEVREEPRTTASIEDRRNELAGNVSLNQELYFIRKINELVKGSGAWETGEDGRPRKVLRLPGPQHSSKEYKPIKVRRLEISEPLDYASKLDRSLRHLERLVRDGERQAKGFLEAVVPQIALEEAWERLLHSKDQKDVRYTHHLDAVMGFFTENPVIELVSPADPSGAPSSAEVWRGEGPEMLRSVLEWCADRDLAVEQSRDYQVRRDGPDGRAFTCWVLATARGFGDPIKGRVATVVRGEKIESLAFYPLSRELDHRLRGALRARAEGSWAAETSRT